MHHPWQIVGGGFCVMASGPPRAMFAPNASIAKTEKLILTSLYDIIKVHNRCKDNCRIGMLKCKHRKEMTLWKTKT